MIVVVIVGTALLFFSLGVLWAAEKRVTVEVVNRAAALFPGECFVVEADGEGHVRAIAAADQ